MCCLPFITHDDEPLTKVPGLKNPIHPIFAKSQFKPQHDATKDVNMPFRYESLKPALQLTSRCLKLDSVVKLIVVKADGDLRVEKKASVFEPITWAQVQTLKNKHPRRRINISRHPKPEHETVTDAMRLRAEEILTQNIDMIDIDVLTKQDGGSHCEYSNDPLPQHLAVLFPLGRRSRILIDASLYHDIDWASRCRTRGGLKRWLERHDDTCTEDNFPGKDIPSLKLVHFARTLIHELFHALEAAYNPRTSRSETFYGESAMSECGYEVENAIFGGLLTSFYLDPPEEDYQFCAEGKKKLEQGPGKPMLLLRPWPSRISLELYKHDKDPIGVRRDHRGPVTDTVQRVDSAFVEQLLTEKFWEAGVGPGPLSLPTVGTSESGNLSGFAATFRV